MAAELGNKYAEKWTRDAVLEILAQILELSKDKKVFYIGSALAKVGLYHEWYSYVADKFKDDIEVFHTIKNIDQVFEAKLVDNTLEGELNPTMAIFTLKNKHEWKDKVETENHNYDKTPDRLTKDQIDKLLDNL